MKRKNTQLGSLHVIVIAVLFVALMATLGVVFYQNFIGKKNDDTPKNTTAIVKTSTNETARVAFNSDIYSMDHPKDWKVTTAKLETSTMGGSTTTVANADGTVRVTFTITESLPETACSASDELKLSAYYVDSVASAEKLAGIPLYLVETISDNNGGGYQYKIGLTPDGGDTHAVVGQTHCNIMQVGIASTAVYEKKKLIHPTIQATIDFPKLPASPKAASKDMQTIKDLMSTEDYKRAVKILESARKE